MPMGTCMMASGLMERRKVQAGEQGQLRLYHTAVLPADIAESAAVNLLTYVIQ